ncbi:TIGR00725 family protein [Granulosicoccus sp.]|nr:TIGR00725 family protein [Granulosicoccus sp.]
MKPSKVSRQYTVAVIGDARAEPDSVKYKLAQDCGALLMEKGFTVVTGGLGGVMEAASRGARESDAWTSGRVVALLPGSDPTEANSWADVVVPTSLDHLRNAVVAQSDAVIAIGGGAGTLSEMAFAWIHRRLIVGLRVDGWSGQLADQCIDNRTRYRDIDDDKVFGADGAAEAVSIVVNKVGKYILRHQSIR